MKDDNYFKEYIKNTSKLINPNINLFLYALIDYLFINPSKSQKSEKKEALLFDITDKINEEIIIKKDKYIDIKDERKRYSINNFKNIIYFINTQNKKYAGEIIEGILILIFNKVFNTEKDNTFGKYVYNNLAKLKDSTNYELANWFEQAPNLFRNEELHDYTDLLSKDASIDEVLDQDTIKFQETSPFFNLILDIFKYKYILLSKEYKNDKTMNYINRGIFNSQEMGNKIYESLKEKNKTTLEKDASSNSISKLVACLYFSQEFGRIRKIPINMMRAFFISVYIYYQNKHSPLMKYIEPMNSKNNEKIDKKTDLAYIPFVYDLKGACVEGRFANIILCPLRVEPRISSIILCQNNLRETGLFELAKTLVFNKNIKKIEYNKSLLKSYFLDYFNFGFGLYNDYSVEELNVSYNYLKDDCGVYFSKFISRLRGLKTLNLSSNEIKSGMNHIFIVLRKLYKKQKIQLENLYLNKCFLDDTSLYELGELLKCKYCKLKRVYLNMNNKPKCFNLLKMIKKNKSLVEIHFNKNNYSNEDINDINRIINMTNIQQLYFSKNKITNFNNCIRIIFRTKIITDKKLNLNNNKDNKNGEKKDDNILLGNNGMLINLDLSSNEAWILNRNQINLLYKILQQMSLSCLDIAHIIYGANPDKINKEKIKDSYKNSVENIQKYLEVYKKEYKRIFGEKISCKVDINKYEQLENNELIQLINDKFGDFINEKINNQLAIYPVYLKEQVNEIIKKIKQNEKYEEIKNKINSDDEIDSIDDKKLLDKIVNYMILKKAEKNLININKKLKEKKLIII